MDALKQELTQKPSWMIQLEQLITGLKEFEETQKQQVEGLKALQQGQDGTPTIL